MPPHHGAARKLGKQITYLAQTIDSRRAMDRPQQISQIFNRLLLCLSALAPLTQKTNRSSFSLG